MSKSYISRILAALLFIVPLAAFVMPDMEKMANERRRIAAFPELPSTFQSRYVKRFFQDIDAFFADRFPLRSSLMRLSMTLYEAGGDSLNMDKCYRGKDDWLFLGNSYGRCVDKLQGKARLSGHNLRRQTEIYGKLRDAAKKCGAEFFLFVGPDKSSVYPEYLPPLVVPAKRRFIAPLLESLNGLGVRVYDPTDRLLEAKSSGLLYYRTDTHWNARGACEAFAGFAMSAGLPPLPPVSFVQATARSGDLVDIGGYARFPLTAGDSFTPHWNVPIPPPRKKNGLTTNDHAGSDKTVWVFGDSFANALEPYITATFRETRFFRHKEFNLAISSQLPKPDMMLWVIVERDFAKSD